MSKFTKYILLLVLVLVLTGIASESVQAQCAMCKATIENNSTDGGNFGAALNKGILYLMTIPYLIAGVIGYLWYKNSRENKGK